METCCGTRTVPRSQQCFPNLDLRICHHKARHHIVEDCRVLWKTGRRLQLAPAGLPRDHLPILLTQRYTLQPQRGEASTALAGIRWDLQAIAGCLLKGDKQATFLQVVDSAFEKAKSRLRENPTADALWALWVDCMREPAQTFFSLHLTSKRDDAQKRLSALRCKLVSEQAIRREKMGKFWETYGHLGDYSEQQLHARHRLMSLIWHMRRWTRQSAAARRTSLKNRSIYCVGQDERSRNPGTAYG